MDCQACGREVKDSMREKIKAFFENNRCSFVFALGLTLLVVTILIAATIPCFDSNDDRAMRTLVDGARYTADPHLVYQNYLLGCLLLALYTLPLRLPWYTLLQYAALIFAFTGLVWAIENRMRSPLGTVVSLLVLIFSGYETLTLIQFTRTAGVVSACGMLVLAEAVNSRKVNRKAVAGGLLLGCFGFMFRVLGSLSAFVITCPMALPVLLDRRGKEKKEYFQYVFRRLAPFALLGAICLGLYTFDWTMYRISPDWKAYKETVDDRTELLDYGFPDFNQERELYDSLGINATAFSMFYGWNFADPEVLSPQVARTLNSLRPRRSFSRALVRSFALTCLPHILKEWYAWLFWFAFFLWLTNGRKRLREWLIGAFTLGLFLLLHLYLFFIGRFWVNRVDFIFWFSCSIPFLWMSRGTKALRGILIAAACFTAVAGMRGELPGIEWRTQAKMQSLKKTNKRIRKRYRKLAKDKEHLYIARLPSLMPGEGYEPFDVTPKKIASNILSLGGWMVYTGPYMETMRAYGVSNPFRDLIDNENVFLVDYDVSSTLDYLRSYYCETASAEEVESLSQTKIYRITSHGD